MSYSSGWEVCGLTKKKGEGGERANEGERDTYVRFFLVRSLWLNKEEEGGGERAS